LGRAMEDPNRDYAASTPGEDDTDGDLRQRDTRLLRFPTARCYRESGMMNARKRIEIWNAGVKEHFEALSEVTSRGADFRAFREFLQVRVAQRDTRLLRFPTTRCYRESGITNARKRIEIWNAGVKEHLEALSEVASRGADFRAFREFLQVRVAHWDALWRSIQSLGGLVCE
jgi:uncharacterized protein (UPF0335 family)